MAKIILIPDNIKQIDENLKNVDGFIVGLKGLSVNRLLLSEEQLFNLLKKKTNLYLSLNKNYQNSDLEYLEKMMKKFKKVSGVLYADLAVLNLNEKLKLNLIWDAEHFTTNYETLKTLNNYGVKGMFVSLDLNLKEILQIRKNSQSILFVQVFGYYPLFNSLRHHLSNFSSNFNLKLPKEQLYLKEKSDYYPIVERADGTTIYSSKIISAFNYLNQLSSFNYWVINGFLIDNSDIKKVINIFKEKNDNRFFLVNNFSNLDEFFLKKETFYKLKERPR